MILKTQKGLDDIFSLAFYLDNNEKKVVKKAYDFAENAHKDQKRKSGEPYFIHLVATAKNLAKIKMDAATIAAGLLHDSVEDGVATEEDLKKEFGDEIAFLVDGVTKLGKVRYQGMKRHNESLKKLFIATSKDIRVAIIKFADRLHNMQTLDHVKPEKRLRIATETLDIYAPLAYRLGITTFSKQLEDLSFPYVYPEAYQKTNKILSIRKKQTIQKLEKIIKSIKKKLGKNNILNFVSTYRIKGIYSLYKKLKRKK
jgi:GTP pyrophosphokinase